MNIYLFARLHALEGNAEAVRAAILEVQGPTRAEAGCLAYHAFEATHGGAEFYIHSAWVDQAAFDSHLKQPHTQRFADRVENLIDGALKPVLTTLLK